MVITIHNILNIKSLQYLQTDSRIVIFWQVYFICSKLKLKQQIKQKYFKTRGAYYTRKYEYFGILRAQVGVRIISLFFQAQHVLESEPDVREGTCALSEHAYSNSDTGSPSVGHFRL